MEPPKPRRAVALKYELEQVGAPEVLAKGREAVADRILALAAEHGIPVHQDSDLVELLSAAEVGDEIPVELYAAVAQLLTFLHELNQGLHEPNQGLHELDQGPSGMPD